jgi:hypothetical protein
MAFFDDEQNESTGATERTLMDFGDGSTVIMQIDRISAKVKNTPQGNRKMLLINGTIKSKQYFDDKLFLSLMLLPGVARSEMTWREALKALGDNKNSKPEDAIGKMISFEIGINDVNGKIYANPLSIREYVTSHSVATQKAMNQATKSKPASKNEPIMSHSTAGGSNFVGEDEIPF